MIFSDTIFPQQAAVYLLAIMLSVIWLVHSGCTRNHYDEGIRSVTDEEAEQFENKLRDELSINTEDDLEISLWASEKLLGDPVGIKFDNEGRAWIATTTRRRTSIPNAGDVSHWTKDNLSWRSVEEMSEFLRRNVVPERSEENSWLRDFNDDGVIDWQDMTVERDSIFMLEDLTQNGYANQARVMDWDFYSEVTEVTGSVLYHKGELIVVRSPDVLRIRDSNNNGIWNSAESISHGYGVHISSSGHGMSGLKVGPAGRIYWAIGDIGMNVIDDQGKRWYYPDVGAIMRSDPDGSNFEVYASGLRNLHEFDFDNYGNLIGIDNDGPFEDFDRLVYVIDGSDSGWRIYWQRGKFSDPKNNDYNVWLSEEYFNTYFEEQTAHILPPLAPYYSGPAGFVFNPGSALSEEWKDHFFASSFVGSPNRSGINAFTLKENGASFELDTNRTVLQGLLSTSLDIGPDGSLYTTDWIEGWVTKGTGRVWKIDTPADLQLESRQGTRALLAENFSNRTSPALIELLSHEDMRVRKKAQFELVDRDDVSYLLKALEQTEHQLARIHGIWGLAQAGRRDIQKVEPLIKYLNDSDPEIRAQTAKMLGDVRFEQAVDSLIPLLEDKNARVQFFAAEALGRIGYPDAIEPIAQMIGNNNDKDIYLRQAGAIALGRIGDIDALVDLEDHPSKAVRLAALVALRRLDSPGVVRFLKDHDETVVTDAARAINDEDFIEEGLPELAKMLDQDRFTGEPLLRRAINANLYGGTPANATRLAAFVLREDVSEELRVEALNTLSVWPEPSVFDRVTGKYRGPITNDPDHARQAAEPVIAQILIGESRTMKIGALRTAGSLQTLSVVPEILTLIHDDTDSSSEVRIASLTALQDMEYEGIDEVIAIALEDDEPAVRMTALNNIPDMNLPAESTVPFLEILLENGTIEERQTALKILAMMDDPSSYAILDRQLDLLISGDLIPEIQLDLILAIEAVRSESLHEKLSKYQSGKPDDDPSTIFAESLYGGDSEAGRRVFTNHAGAQCTQCHGGSEGAGPDLESVGSRLSRQQLLEAIVAPNARITPGYGVVTLTLQDGDNVRGVLSSETKSHIILTREGEELKFNKADINDYSITPSAMPAMGNVLSRREIRNLVEYLANLK